MMRPSRTNLLLAVFAVLVLANVLVRWRDGGLDTGLFFGGDEISENSAKLARSLEEVRRLPELSFRVTRTAEGAVNTADRNPFLFGLDRQKQDDQQRAMAELAMARSMVEHISEVPEPLIENLEPRFEGELLAIIEDSREHSRVVAVSLDDDIHILRAGQTLGGKYKLLEINYLQVRFLHLPDQKEILVEVE